MKTWFDPPLWDAISSCHNGNPQHLEHLGLSYSHYYLSVNLLSFLSIGSWRPKLHYPIGILGLPLSISHPGIELESPMADEDFCELIKILPQKGLQTVFNLPYYEAYHQCLLRLGYVPMQTLPTTELKCDYADFQSYLQALRAPYRYRMGKMLGHLDSQLVRSVVNSNEFDLGLYRLYEAVYQRSEYPLEKASIEFFKTFPGQIVALFEKSGEALGFYQYIVVKDCCYFVFCGLNYAKLNQHNTYMLLLSDLLRTALNMGCNHLDFGQTTELMKLKLGFQLNERLIYVKHKNPIMMYLLRLLAPKVSYQLPILPKLHVFKS